MTIGYIDFSGSDSGGPPPGQVIVAGFSSAPGWPLDRATIDIEELTSPGVNGRRWREVASRFRAWETTILVPATAYIDAIRTGRFLLQQHGAICVVRVPLSGTTYQWNNVHFECENPEAMAGAIYGSGLAGYAAHVRCACRFTLTELTTSPA